MRVTYGAEEGPIPISAVTGADDGVRLNLTKDEVGDLPPVDLDHQEAAMPRFPDP